MSDTVGVTYEVLQVEHVRDAGRLLALATVSVGIAGIETVWQGLQIRKLPDGTLQCLAPQWRHPRTGRWLPCILVPAELSAAIAKEALAAITDPRITPNSGAIAA